MKLEVTWRCDDEPQHARIENADLDTDYDGTGWSGAYVSFSGYFRSHGPHVFAAAPDLLAALKMHHEWSINNMREYSEFGEESVAYRATKSAIEKAEGKG